VIYGTLSQSMSFVELQIPPKALLEIFEAKSVSSGMTEVAPGGASLAVGGLDDRGRAALPLVPVVLTLGSSGEINLLSKWLWDKLQSANVSQILINGVEIEVTGEAITNAISEALDVASDISAADDEDPEAIICLRVSPDVDLKLYVQGSAIQKCSLCQSSVLVSPSNQAILAHRQNQIVCMECWTQAHSVEMSSKERGDKLCKLSEQKSAGEKAYDDMYDARSSSDASRFYSETKESFYTAIELARELGLEQEVEELQKRLAHIKSVFRSQFS
jgi:hypothetical protein